MNLLELKSYVDRAIEGAEQFGQKPTDIIVSIQVDDTPSEALWSDDIELTYDGDGQASGCVLHGWSVKTNNIDTPDQDNVMLAEFKCLKCFYEYSSQPGPTVCPKCGHLYVKWVNYKVWYEQSETCKYNKT